MRDEDAIVEDLALALTESTEPEARLVIDVVEWLLDVRQSLAVLAGRT